MAEEQALKIKKCKKNTKATSVRGNPESFTISEAKEDMNMDTQGNVNNPSGQNPRPNGGTISNLDFIRAKAGIIHGTRFLLSDSNCKLPTIIRTSFFWKLEVANKVALYYQTG